MAADEEDGIFDVTTFVENFEAEFGEVHPNVFPGTYNQVLASAKRDLKFLLVYLHRKEHEPCRRFCSNILTKPDVVEFVNDKMIFWSCSLDLEEGKRAATGLFARTFPFVAILVLRDENKVQKVGNILKTSGPEMFLQRIQRLMDINQEFLGTARILQQELELNRVLRQEQERAYEESLRLDQEKQRLKDEEERLKNEEIEAARNAEELKRALA